MRNKIRKLFIGVLLLSFGIHAILVPSVLNGLTLCIEKDGHMALESSNGSCCPGIGIHSGEAEFHRGAESDCETCLDVSLNFGDAGAYLPSTFEKQLFKDLFVSHTQGISLLPLSAYPPSRFRLPILEPAHLIWVRSTVLRV